MKRLLVAIILLIFVVYFASISLATTGSLSVAYQLTNNRTNPGEENTILLTFSNPSAVTVYDIQAAVSNGSYITMKENLIRLGSIGSGSSQQTGLKFSVGKDAVSMISYISLKVTYYRAAGEIQTTDVYIPITIGKEPILQIQNIKNSTAEPGSTVLLSFDVANVGDSAAKDIRISINQTKLVSRDSNEVFIESLPGKNSRTVSFTLTADPEINIGLYSLPVSLTYSDGTGTATYSATKHIGFTIAAPIELITTLESSKNLYYGKIATLTVSLANRGKADAKFLTVRASSDYGTKEFYIGKLESDDYETIDIPQDLTKNKESYKLSLELEYKDDFGNSYAVKKYLDVMPVAAPIEIPYTTVIGLIVLIAAGYWWLKRKKK